MTATAPETEPCDGCDTPEPANWSPAFAAWLCVRCRWRRTEQELQPTGLIPAGLQPLEETTR